MAIAFVAKSTELFADNATSISPSLTGTTAGNFAGLLVVQSPLDSTSPAPAIPQPTGWSTARADVGPTGGGDYRPSAAIFYKENLAGGTLSVTVTLANGSYASASIVEFSGIVTSGSLDVTAGQTQTASTSSTSGTTGTTAQADELVLTVAHPEDTVGGTTSLSTPAATGYTNIETEPTNSVHIAYDTGYKIVSATGTQVASWTWTTTSYFAGAIATFKATATAAPQPPLPQDTSPPLGRRGLKGQRSGSKFEHTGFQLSPLSAPNELSADSFHHELPPISGRATRGYDLQLEGFQAPAVVADIHPLYAAYQFDLAPPSGRVSRGYEFQLEGFTQAGVVIDSDNPAPPLYDIPPPSSRTSRGYRFDLEGFTRPAVVDDNDVSADAEEFELPPTSLRASRGYKFALEGFQAPAVGLDNATSFARAFDQLTPAGRNFEYELEGFSAPPVGPDASGPPATTNPFYFALPAEGENFDYELAGYQQGVVGPNADQSNVIPMWFEVPQSAQNYGNYVQPFFQAGVGPDGIPPVSNPSQWYDNAPVLFIPPVLTFASMPLSEDGVPALESNSSNWYENPPFVRNLLLPFEVGFDLDPAGDDFIPILESEPSMVFESPQIVLPFSPAYGSLQVAPLTDEAPFTESVQVAYYELPREGRNFDYELRGFQAGPATPEPIPVLPTQLFPDQHFPKVPYDELMPFIGMQVAPTPASVFPPVGSPATWRPTIRPRRR